MKKQINYYVVIEFYRNSPIIWDFSYSLKRAVKKAKEEYRCWAGYDAKSVDGYVYIINKELFQKIKKSGHNKKLAKEAVNIGSLVDVVCL